MNIPRAQLDEALLRVQQGLMQPDEAARWLIQLEQAPLLSLRPNSLPSASLPAGPSEGKRMTAADLMNQLGPPPMDIQQDWDRQLAIIAARFQNTHGRSLPPLSASDLLVDNENRLSLAPHVEAILLAPSNKESWSPTSTPVAKPTAAPNQNQASHTSGASLPDSRLQSLLKQHPRLMPSLGIVAIALILAGTLYAMLGLSDDTAVALKESRSVTSPASSIFSPTSTSTSRRMPTSVDRPSRGSIAGTPDRDTTEEINPGDLSLLEPLDNEATVATSSDAMPRSDATTTNPTNDADSKPADAPDRSSLGLSTFGESDWLSADKLSPAAGFNAESTATEESSDPSESPESMEPGDSVSSELPSDQDTTEGDAVSEEEAATDDSPIQQSVSLNAIELPAIPSSTNNTEEIVATSLIDAEVSDLTLSFPFATDISLQASGDAWEVKDTKDQATVAWLEKNPRDESGNGQSGLGFRWSSDAYRHSIARQLPAGLLNLTLKDGTKRPVFLRPTITAEPWQIDFSVGDTKAAWPISLAPPTGVSSLAIEFTHPETVIQTWIEPHDPQRVRRSQSIVQFSLDADDTIAIRSRIDVRTGSRIQLRMRHAAQLDPAYPWQMISSAQVEKAMTQVTDHLERANFEAAELKSAYYEASTYEKKVLGPRREAIDSIVMRLKALNERLGKFDQLLAQLNQAALMSITLQVTWPEGSSPTTQTIFEMKSP